MILIVGRYAVIHYRYFPIIDYILEFAVPVMLVF